MGPPSLVAGDVLLQDGIGGPILDVVRFNPAGNGGNPDYHASLLFYSDNVDGFDALADTSSPPEPASVALVVSTLVVLARGTRKQAKRTSRSS